MYATAPRTHRTARAPSPAATTSQLWQRAASLAVLLGSLVGVGCGSLPQHVERPLSWSLPDTDDTPLARLVQASTPPQQAQQSGFRLLADGADALATRLTLIQAARRSLDLQYFLISDDASGDQLLDALRAAAERGVRVRLLLDDLHAGAHEARLAALDRMRAPRCGCSTRCRCAAPRWRGACWVRCTSSSASTGACTTSCSSPTAASPWPAAATSATTTSCAARSPTSSTWTSWPPGRWWTNWPRCSTASGTTTPPIRRAACCRRAARPWRPPRRRRSMPQTSTAARHRSGAAGSSCISPAPVSSPMRPARPRAPMHGCSPARRWRSRWR